MKKQKTNKKLISAMKKDIKLFSRIFVIIIIPLLIILILALVINTGIHFIKDSEETSSIVINDSKNINITEKDIIESCENKTLLNTSYCLRDNVKSFYIYNETDDDKKLTFEQLKTRGGDCKDWSEFYNRTIKKLGYYSHIVKISTLETEQKQYLHDFTVISDKEGYCILDQMNVNCIIFSRSN